MSSSARRRTRSAGTRRPAQARQPNLIPRQFDLAAAIARDQTAKLTAEQLRDHTYPLLTPIEAVLPEDRDRYTYARRLGTDFLELLVHQDGECVRRLSDEEVAKVGETDLFALARERLRQIPDDGCELVRRDQGEFHVLRGASEFTASKLVLLPDVLRPVLGRTMDERNGALVSVPSPHELVFAPVGANIPATLVHLARYTLMTYEDGRHPLSPVTYWWQDGALTPVVTLDNTGFVEFQLPPAFFDAAKSAAQDDLA